MSLRVASNLVAVCDSCGPGWWAVDPACGNAAPHFLSPACAIEQLTTEYGWIIRPRTLRQPGMLCRRCARRGDDRKDKRRPQGSRLTSWLASVLGAHADASNTVPTAAPEAQLPAGHPESIMHPLAPDDEEFLAAMDPDLFPEDTE